VTTSATCPVRAAGSTDSRGVALPRMTPARPVAPRCGRDRCWRRRCSTSAARTRRRRRRGRRGWPRRGWCRFRTSGRGRARPVGCRWPRRARRSRAASGPDAAPTRAGSGRGAGPGRWPARSPTPTDRSTQPAAAPVGSRRPGVARRWCGSVTAVAAGAAVRGAGWAGLGEHRQVGVHPQMRRRPSPVGEGVQFLVGGVIDESVAVGVGRDRDDVLQVAESDPGRRRDDRGEVLRSGGGRRAGGGGDDDQQAATRAEQPGAAGQQPGQPDAVVGVAGIQRPARGDQAGRLCCRAGRRVGGRCGVRGQVGVDQQSRLAVMAIRLSAHGTPLCQGAARSGVLG
jgi:hypothetical protein